MTLRREINGAAKKVHFGQRFVCFGRWFINEICRLGNISRDCTCGGVCWWCSVWNFDGTAVGDEKISDGKTIGKFPKTHLPIITTFISGYQSILHSLLKIKHALIIFIPIFSDPFHLPTPVQFAMEKCILQQQRTAIEKQFIAFSCNIYTEFIFEAFSVVMREKMGIEWMKIWGREFRVLLNGKINFPPTPRIGASLSTLLIRNVDLIRWKNIEKFPRNLVFCGK